MSTRRDLHGLTIFRFFTAFYVFLFHCNLRYQADVYKWLQSAISNGAIGMSFFFVLSGFVLAWASRNGIKENYYRSRFARIFPAYLVMGLITAPFLLEYKITHSISYVLLFATTSQSWFPDSFNQWHFSGSWSISTEMFFYLTFPLLLPLINKRPVIALSIAIFASSIIIPTSIMLTGSAMFPYYYVSPIHRLPEFVAGVAAGCIFIQGFRFTRFNTSIFILAILLLLFVSSHNNIGWMKRNYITVPATCLIVYYLAAATIKENKITKPLIYLGKISYSFYLMQIPIMMYISKHHEMLSALPVWFIWTILAVINLIMASACYHFIENNKAIKSAILTWGNKPNSSLDKRKAL